LLMEMKINTTTIEKYMEVPQKTKNRTAIWFRNFIPRDIPEGMWPRELQRHLHTCVYCSTIHNSKAMETTKVPHYWQMD
jgi:hypothetical protein